MKKYIFSFFILLVTLITLTIFSLSLQDASTSNALSKAITEQVLPIIKDIAGPISSQLFTRSELNYLIREFAHVVEFFLLALCLIFTLRLHKRSLGYCITWTLIYSSLIAFADEFLQQYLSPGRAFQFIDIIKDLFGVLLALLIFVLLTKCKTLISSKLNSSTKD